VVLVHIDLEGGHPDASSLMALAAGRAIATSWGAPLCAAAIVPAREPAAHAEIERALASGGADRIVLAPTRGSVVPLWDAIGAPWTVVLDQLRPRLVLFGGAAPSASELAPRTAARIGARLLVRARAQGDGHDAVLRDRDGLHARIDDGGAVVATIGRAARARACDGRVDLVVLPAVDGDARVEIVGVAPAEAAHAIGALVAIGDDLADDPSVVEDARRLADQLGGQLAASPNHAARLGALAIERSTPLAPELCVQIGGGQLDLAGATSVIKIGAPISKLVDGALPGSPGTGLAEILARLESAP
jgi:electron transfer flavoprotein alpha subunit